MLKCLENNDFESSHVRCVTLSESILVLHFQKRRNLSLYRKWFIYHTCHTKTPKCVKVFARTVSKVGKIANERLEFLILRMLMCLIGKSYVR